VKATTPVAGPTEGVRVPAARVDCGARSLQITVHTLSGKRPRALDLNAGLLAAHDADVVAFVDDDCRPDDGWLDALCAAWAAADDDVAVVGGPITVDTVGARPAWCSDDLLSTFASQHEPQPTYHAGNLSFRTQALRGVGGFWPARGHRLGRDWFAPEHEAQRELVRAGWNAQWAPDAAVTRLVTPGLTRSLHFRLRTGERAAVVGEPGDDALKSALRFAAGVPLAGSRVAAVDRAGRAAERFGAALGGRFARRDFQAVAAATPFRASVAQPPARPRRLGRGPRSLILIYHRVIDRVYGPEGLCVSPANFARQLDVLGDTIVELERVIAGDAPDGSVAITFDDGYVDNLAHAAPLLAGRPATLFVCTGLERFWWDDLYRLIEDRSGERLTARGGAWWPRDRAQREFVGAQIVPQLVALHPDDVEAAMNELGRAAVGRDEDRRMTVDELRVAARTFTIGAHTRRHPGLARLAPDEQYEELAGSREDLERWLGVRCDAVSYPFGVPGFDVDRTTLRIAREAGFTGGVVNVSGAIAARDRNAMALPRVPAPDVGADAFAAWLRDLRAVSAAQVLA
jgi:peptidoglycan/xylan/chitin deacetylase (PgdA/CDA1 family)